jgi:uncharacterized protein (TIGR00251 family)
MKKEDLKITVLIKPRSSRNAVLGIHDDALKIALTAPPVEGKANKSLIKFLSKTLHLPQSDIQIIKGAKSKKKVLLIRNIDRNNFLKAIGNEATLS